MKKVRIALGLAALLGHAHDTSHNRLDHITLTDFSPKEYNSSPLSRVDLCDDFLSDDLASQSFDQLANVELVKQLHRFLLSYGIGEGKAFCILSDTDTAKKQREQGLAVSRKDSFRSLSEPLLEHAVSSPNDIRAKASAYDSNIHDIYIYPVFTPSSQITRDFLNQKPLYIAQLFFHERFHDEVEFDRILAEAMCDLVSHIGTKEFFDSSPEREKYLPQIEKDLNYQLRRAKVVTAVYDDLDELYARKDLSFEEKMRLRDTHFARISAEFGDKVVNNATIAREMYYIRHFPALYELHLAMGNDFLRTIDFYRSLPKETSEAESDIKARLHQLRAGE